MMTRNEVTERAQRIWGPQPHYVFHNLGNGEWLVWFGKKPGTKQWNITHHLDGNGHAVCHEDCKRKEEKL